MSTRNVIELEPHRLLRNGNPLPVDLEMARRARIYARSADARFLEEWEATRRRERDAQEGR